jgi:transposase-like protein
MKGHGTKFGRKKEAAVVALLSHRNIDEAAKAVGVAPNTLLNWMKEDAGPAGLRQVYGGAFPRRDIGQPALLEERHEKGHRGTGRAGPH